MAKELFNGTLVTEITDTDLRIALNKPGALGSVNIKYSDFIAGFENKIKGNLIIDTEVIIPANSLIDKLVLKNTGVSTLQIGLTGSTGEVLELITVDSLFVIDMSYFCEIETTLYFEVTGEIDYCIIYEKNVI